MRVFRIGSMQVWTLALCAIGMLGTAMAVSGAAKEQSQEMKGKAQKHAMSATASLASADDPKLSGTVTFTRAGDQVHVVAHITGVDKPGPHAFHVHEKGLCTPDAPGKSYTSAGGHFNPAGVPHACPDAPVHHSGDFGNIDVKADGTADLDMTTSSISLSGPDSIIGKAIILHAGTDDCASQPSGNAGARLACGVVKAGGTGAASR